MSQSADVLLSCSPELDGKEGLSDRRARISVPLQLQNQLDLQIRKRPKQI
jgi:hypothetical protein